MNQSGRYPIQLRRSATFSGAISPQPSLPDSLSPDFSYKMKSFELETPKVQVRQRKRYGVGRKRKFLGNQFGLKRKQAPLP